MEVVILVGIQATGKSTFYKTHFSDTHVRINLDMLRTRHRERKLFELCLELRQPCVVDNTNLTRQDRQRYLAGAQQHGFPVRGYYFASRIHDAMTRNARRGAGTLPEKGVLGAYARLEVPSYEEGFEKLYYVKIVDGTFQVSDWKDPDD
jgi:predicted kinase